MVKKRMKNCSVFEGHCLLMMSGDMREKPLLFSPLLNQEKWRGSLNMSSPKKVNPKGDFPQCRRAPVVFSPFLC